MKKAVISCLFVLLCGSARAQPAPPETVFVGVQTMTVEHSTIGSAVALWQHPSSPNTFVEVGGTTGRDGGNQWSQGHAGLLLRRSLTTWQAGADIGWAPSGGGAAPSAYQKWSGAVDRGIGGPTDGVRLEAMFVRVAAIQIGVVGGGAYFTRGPAIVHINGYALRIGSQTGPAAMARVDVARGRWTWLAGLTASGRYAAPTSTVDPFLRSARGGFAGTRVRVGSPSILATCERTEHAGVSTTVIAIGLQLPVR